MAKGRQLKGRIRSVQNTRKITKTMELVATSKLKRAQDRVIAARPYAEALREVLADLITAELAERFPLLRRPAPPSKGGPSRAALILLTSNRGLAGGFNAIQLRHGDIEDYHVRQQALRLIHQCAPVGGGSDDLEFTGQQAGKALQHKAVIVSQKQALGHG